MMIRLKEKRETNWVILWSIWEERTFCLQSWKMKERGMMRVEEKEDFSSFSFLSILFMILLSSKLFLCVCALLVFQGEEWEEKSHKRSSSIEGKAHQDDEQKESEEENLYFKIDRMNGLICVFKKADTVLDFSWDNFRYFSYVLHFIQPIRWKHTWKWVRSKYNRLVGMK